MSGENDHIAFEVLVDLVEERAPAERAAEARAHIQACSHCQQELAWASRVTTLMRSDELEDAPLHVVARAVRSLHAVPTPAPQPAPGVLRRLVARLQFDSDVAFTPAFGMRSGQPEGRQMLFTTEEVEVDLRITPYQNQWVVTGQMLGPCEGGSVELVGDEAAETAALNDLCEFDLPAVEAGHYTLLLRYADAEVEVSDLQIGGDRGTS